MAKTTTPLTATQVTNTKEKEYSLCDGRALRLRIKPNGSKIWLFNYIRQNSTKRSNLDLGPFPDVSLASARKKCDETRTLLSQGIDPQLHSKVIEKQELVEQCNTLKLVTDTWFEIKKQKVSENHGQKLYRRLSYIYSHLLARCPLVASLPTSHSGTQAC